MPSHSSRRPTAESRLIEDWERFGNGDEMRRICKDILEKKRPRQGYPVAFEAWHIIRAHVDHWRLDAPVELDGSRKNQSLLKTGPKIVRRLDDALRDMIDLHQQARERRWYGQKIVAGEIKGPAARSWTRFPALYERVRKALDADPLWRALRDTPQDMWLISPPGNPANRRTGALKDALSGIGLTQLQVNDVSAFMANTPQNAAQPKRRELAKISTAAKRLDVSMDTVDRLVKAGKLPVIRLPSGRRRIDLAELDALIDDWAAGSR